MLIWNQSEPPRPHLLSVSLIGHQVVSETVDFSSANLPDWVSDDDIHSCAAPETKDYEAEITNDLMSRLSACLLIVSRSERLVSIYSC